MGIEIVTMEDCASNYGVFKVKSSAKSKKGAVLIEYTVTMHGSENPAHCTCLAFKFSGDKMECKHVKQVWDEACMYNPQWHDAKENPPLRPVSYTYDRFTGNKCECGAPLVAVRRAV